jgi:hypothetical protein
VVHDGVVVLAEDSKSVGVFLFSSVVLSVFGEVLVESSSDFISGGGQEVVTSLEGVHVDKTDGGDGSNDCNGSKDF